MASWSAGLMPAYDLIDFSYRRMDIFAYYFCTKSHLEHSFEAEKPIAFTVTGDSALINSNSITSQIN